MPVSGTVSCWNEEKGFGFIVEFGTQESIYVHRSGLLDEGSLHVGDEVEFERSQDAMDIKRGRERAVEVHVTKQNSNGAQHDTDDTGLDDNPHEPPAAEAEADPGSCWHLLERSQEEKPYDAEDRPYGFDDDMISVEDKPLDDDAGGFQDKPYVRKRMGRARDNDNPYEFDDRAHEGPEDRDKPRDFDDGMDGIEDKDKPYDPDERPEGAEEPRDPSGEEREVGRVKSWYDDKKFGFVIPDKGGDSIYVHCTGLLGGMEYLREGDLIEFERFQDEHDKKRGKERAANVRLLEDAREGRNFNRQDRFRNQDFPAPPQPPAPPQAGRSSRWNDDRGFGPRRPYYEEEGRYVPRMAPIGSAPSWESEDVGYDKDGRETDYRARTSSSSSSGFGYGRDGRGGYGKSWRGRDDYDDYDYGYRYPNHYPRSSRPPRTEVGTVMSWKDDKGFGFILCHGSKESIYCHRTGLESGTSLREGDAVEFERTQSERDAERGKERASNVRLYTGNFDDGPSHYRGGQSYRPQGRDDYPSYVRSYHRDSYGHHGDHYGHHSDHYSHHGYNTSYGNRGSSGYDIGPASSWNDEKGYNTSYGNKTPAAGYEIGTVSAWNDDKGFGFIVTEDTQESVYVHRTGLLAVSGLREGDTVEFGRTQDARDVERGKDRAVNVRILGSGARGRDRSRSPRHR